MSVRIPVIRMKKLVESLIHLVRTDYETKFAAGKETQTLLYQILNGIEEFDYDFYKQGKEIFLRKDTDPRKIEVNLQFNKNPSSIPNIWVREPAKSNGAYNHIGSDLGETLYFNYTDSETELTTTESLSQLRDTKRAVYELVITSDNPLGTILVAEVVYALFLGAQDTLTELFETFNFSMKELMLNNDSAPISLMAKAITIETQFENIVPRIATEDLVNSINFENPTIHG
jgi:hypothetical protein